jgi:hypothetical protein
MIDLLFKWNEITTALINFEQAAQLYHELTRWQVSRVTLC